MRHLTLVFAAFLLLFAAEVRPFKGELTIEQEGEKLKQRFTLSVAPAQAGGDLYLVIRGPGEEEELVPVFDDGTHGDAAAGDGIYTGVTFKKPGTKQRFFLRGTKSGNDTTVYLEAVLFRF